MKNNWKLIKQLHSESQFGREETHEKHRQTGKRKCLMDAVPYASLMFIQFNRYKFNIA